MKRGEILGKEKENVKIIRWMDKCPVLMISSDSTHNTNIIPKGKTNRNGDCMTDYNTTKNGVDLRELRKSLKWYWKVELEQILCTRVVNAWVVYYISDKKLGIKKFRRQLAEHLVVQTPIREGVAQEINKKCTHTFLKPDGTGPKRRKVCMGCYDRLRSSGLSSREADKVRRVKLSQ
ncbi:hypothetical protein PR048_000870 [Dryococelus australis]|uniref:PiggyBac transposable element-derived protein domain-containing protein n=1 Tax=Dryococelus australis TaxID=614101 RepID=A0ABQ9IFR9_9NEOP|nr:hypothetical protein PR048_000870 [Dryococelus australis]